MTSTTTKAPMISPETKAKIASGLKIAGAVAAAAGAAFVGYQAIKGADGNVYAETLKSAFDNSTGTAAIIGAVAGAGAGLLLDPVIVNEKPLNRLQNIFVYSAAIGGLAATSKALTNTTEFMLGDNDVGG